MSDPFVGEIRIFPYTFAPMGWAWCEGQVISVSQNPALASIVSNLYGGDGVNTFGLPNLKARATMQRGTGPGLTPRNIAQASGSATATLDLTQTPNHGHTAQTAFLTAASSSTSIPVANISYPSFMVKNTTPQITPIEGYHIPDANEVLMSPQTLLPAGGDTSHENRQPSLGVYFCIALEGLYPVRP